MQTREELQDELVKACKVLYKTGLVDLVGHISARLPNDQFLIKPRRQSWLHLSAADLIVLDFDGNWVGGPPGGRSGIVEWPIHAEVYRARPDIGAVLHSHATDSTLLGALNLPLEPLTRDLQYFGAHLPVYDSLNCLRDHDGLIKTPALGREVAAVLGQAKAALLRYHGNVVVGETVGGAVLAAYYLERGARTLLRAAGGRGQVAIQHQMCAALQQLPRDQPELVAERWGMLQQYHLS